MTLAQTRQLGIEFERRIQTMIPETEVAEKLDTETIFSYLNQYQDKYVQELYRAVDQIPVSNNETYIETLLNSMMSTAQLTPTKDGVFYKCQLPSDFGLYIKTFSTISATYRLKVKDENIDGIIPNELISIKDVNKIITRPQDNMRILRNPVVWLADGNKLGLMYDRYTIPTNVQLEYYRIPKYMDLMTSSPCELPMEMFEPLVSGAVDLYVQYVAGAEARKRQMAEQQKQQQQRKKDKDE